MKTKRLSVLILSVLVVFSLVLPACQKNYKLDEEGLLRLQCNASSIDEILEEVGTTDETSVSETDSTEPTQSEPIETEPTQEPTETEVRHTVPVVSAVSRADGVMVSWEKITDEDLSGYKVVYSKTNPNPQYPGDGYYTYITNRDTTSCLVKASSKISAGDYYFSVTALYEDGSAVPGNAVKRTMPEYVAPTTVPETDRPKPQVSVSTGDNYVKVSWKKITSDDLVGYKVVASKSQSNPAYPGDGYYSWITDADVTSCKIYNGDGYSGGDIGTFSGGEQYYFSVTAVYGDEWQKVAGNAVRKTMPGEPAVTEPHVAPVVSATLQSDGVLVSWNKITVSGFQGYKVVFSATNPNPAYPGDGYYTYITNPNQTTCLVPLSELEPGTYYFSVTALYNDGDKLAGNAVTITITAPEPTPTPIPEPTPTPIPETTPTETSVDGA
ncbi:MAG: hypothetical protein GXY43_01390 [Clostridiaceae bacterium]|nr:hypothetical protein [Clostridiaceae bacterium]